MKNEELDRLFRQKLGQTEATPSPQAWQQLEQQLQHKKTHKTWLYFCSIAASFLLILGVWGSIEYSSNFIPTEPVAQEPAREQQLPVPVQPQPAIEQQLSQSEQESTVKQQVTTEEAIAATSQTAEKKPKTAQNASSTKAGPAAGKSQKQLASTTPAPEPVQIDLPQAESRSDFISLAEAAPEPRVSIPAAVTEQIIIRYKADNETQSLALAGPSEATNAEEAVEEEKDFSARRVIGFLKKVKDNSSNSLAELREAKDELLSLRISRADLEK